MNRRNLLRAPLLGLALLAVCLPALPQQPPRYTVEIIVFRVDGDASGEDPSAAPTLRSTASAELAVTQVTGRRLAGAASRLRAGGGYRILAHMAWSQSAAGWNSRRGVSLSQLGVNVPGLTGNVVLERGQFLHLGFDLKLEDAGRTAQLAEIRRVKPDDAQYYDNPQLGVIALVTSGG
ncbi:MAG TPA: CsiV family protein [Steroidobacteraceae bacterium]|nr:CsiV family protein [Steroidobacteraceae bacterium]